MNFEAKSADIKILEENKQEDPYDFFNATLPNWNSSNEEIEEDEEIFKII